MVEEGTKVEVTTVEVKDQVDPSTPISEKRNDKSSTNNSSTEIKFVPHYTGKQQMATYDTVKDDIVNQIQKTYKYGGDIAKALREETELGTIGMGPPERVMVEIPARMSGMQQFELWLEQEGHDIEYKE